MFLLQLYKNPPVPYITYDMSYLVLSGLFIYYKYLFLNKGIIFQVSVIFIAFWIGLPYYVEHKNAVLTSCKSSYNQLFLLNRYRYQYTGFFKIYYRKCSSLWTHIIFLLVVLSVGWLFCWIVGQ